MNFSNTVREFYVKVNIFYSKTCRKIVHFLSLLPTYFILFYFFWAAVSAGLSLVVLLAFEKLFMCISGHFEQIKID